MTCASGRARPCCKRHRRSAAMEGSITTRGVDQRDPKLIFAEAGLSPRAAASLGKQPRFSGNYKRDVAAASKYWRDSATLLSKLPKKPKRNQVQQIAADAILSSGHATREQFLSHHADAIYRKLTKQHANFLRVDELAFAAAKLVPDLTPNKQQA